MTSKNTALLDMPVAELVKEVYGKAEELKLSFPEISALLRAAAGRIDVFNALLVLSSSVNVQRYSPDYQMHLNHEMAIMRPTDKGTFVSLADYVALMKERNDLNNQLQALAAENSALKESNGIALKILNEVRAQSRAEGIHFAANRLLAAWEAGFIDDTPAMAYDISGAILSALEFLPNADEGEFKRDYADEVRARIRAGEVPNV